MAATPGDLTPELRAQALQEAAIAMENDPGITRGRIAGTGYSYFAQWLRDEAEMWLQRRAPEQEQYEADLREAIAEGYEYLGRDPRQLLRELEENR